MKKIYKSYTDKKLCGVCGGIAQVLGVDSTIVRLVWVLSTIVFGINILLYIICAFVLEDSDVEIVDIPTKKLYKSNKDKKILGICGGIAEYFVIESNIVRIAFLMLSFFGMYGVLAYLICACIIPDAPTNYYGKID